MECKRIEELESALKVIRTWASYDEDNGYQKALIPKDVIRLCDKALMRDKPQQKRMDAIGRASEMMKVSKKKLPKLAVEYAEYLEHKYGMCGEVCITAFAHYAQYVESLPCDDSLYVINNEGRDWFAANK